jgi:hypothetical protein
VVEFIRWPSIPRLFRDITITEKIDGTNAAIGVEPYDVLAPIRPNDEKAVHAGTIDGTAVAVWAQSRSRIITPEDDNFKFAEWVHANAEELARFLGIGSHFGEWWGFGIQRGYDLPKGERRFSLFNTKRWGTFDNGGQGSVPGLYVVPTLYQGPYSEDVIRETATKLHVEGSRASLGFQRPEGIVIYHHQANHCFKYTPYEKQDGHKAK